MFICLIMHDQSKPSHTTFHQVSAAANTADIFVTGASGLVGSNLIRQLVAEGKKVKALYRKQIPDIADKQHVLWVEGDILDVISLDEAMQGVKHVYHCAAIVSFSAHMKYALFKTNIEGTANVVNAALNNGVKKLCYVSSVAALGRTKDGSQINEKTVWTEESNMSNYSKSKYLAEVEVWRGVAEGLKAVMVNPSVILGAGNWNDGSTRVFKTAYEEFPWYTDGVTGFVDVKDVANAMIRLMESDISGERFLLNAENKPYKEVFTTIAESFGKRPPHKKVNRVLAEIVRLTEAVKSRFTGEAPLLTKETSEAAQSVVRFDNSKLKKHLPGFEYTALDETIARICGELKEKYRLN